MPENTYTHTHTSAQTSFENSFDSLNSTGFHATSGVCFFPSSSPTKKAFQKKDWNVAILGKKYHFNSTILRKSPEKKPCAEDIFPKKAKLMCYRWSWILSNERWECLHRKISLLQALEFDSTVQLYLFWGPMWDNDRTKNKSVHFKHMNTNTMFIFPNEGYE